MAIDFLKIMITAILLCKLTKSQTNAYPSHLYARDYLDPIDMQQNYHRRGNNFYHNQDSFMNNVDYRLPKSSILRNSQIKPPVKKSRTKNIISERLDRAVIDNRERRLLYILYELLKGKRIYYICKGFLFKLNSYHKKKEILRFKSRSIDKAMQVCGFTHAFKKYHYFNKNGRHPLYKDINYDNQETYNLKHGKLNNRERDRESLYKDYNTNLWKKEHSDSWTSSNGDSNSWSNTFSYSDSSNFPTHNRKFDRHHNQIGFPNGMIPRSVLNFNSIFMHPYRN